MHTISCFNVPIITNYNWTCRHRPPIVRLASLDTVLAQESDYAGWNIQTLAERGGRLRWWRRLATKRAFESHLETRLPVDSNLITEETYKILAERFSFGKNAYE